MSELCEKDTYTIGLHLKNIFWSGELDGKTRSFDHPSPRCDVLIKCQNRRPLALSTEIGKKWSSGLFFPSSAGAGLL